MGKGDERGRVGSNRRLRIKSKAEKEVEAWEIEERGKFDDEIEREVFLDQKEEEWRMLNCEV